jgi:hypothetical protein
MRRLLILSLSAEQGQGPRWPHQKPLSLAVSDPMVDGPGQARQPSAARRSPLTADCQSSRKTLIGERRASRIATPAAMVRVQIVVIVTAAR